MKKLFKIFVIILMITFISCGSKEQSENYQSALSFYEEGQNKIKTDNEIVSNDSLIDAFSKFIESLRLLERLPEDMGNDEISLVSGAYYKLSNILFHKMGFDAQIDALQMALFYQEMNIDTSMMATLTADLALVYSSVGDMESARYYIKLAEPYLDTTSNFIEPYLKTRTSLATILYYDEKDDSSFMIEREIIAFKYRRELDTKRDSVSVGMGMYHSPDYKNKAKPYLLKVFEIEKFPEVQKCIVMDMLAEIYEKENNIDSMEFCKKYYETYINVENKRFADEKLLIWQYDKYKTERDAKLDALRKQKNKQKRILYFSIILIVVSLATYISILTLKQHKKNISKQKDVTDNALRQHVYEIYYKQKDDVFQSILKEFNTFYPDAYKRFKMAKPIIFHIFLSTFALRIKLHLIEYILELKKYLL